MATYSHIELCAGTGMLGLGIKLALADGIRTMCYVEREAYAAATLVARMEEQALDQAPVWDDVTTISSADFCAFVDRLPLPILLSGGYPCQPFSVAGKRLGANDERHLWPHIAEFIGKTKPELCFFENVPGHLRLGFDRVHADLEQLGYRVAAGLFSAAEVGASHKRERLFILAVSHDDQYRTDRDTTTKEDSIQGVSRQAGFSGLFGGTSIHAKFLGNPANGENDKRRPGQMEYTQTGRESQYAAACIAGQDVAVSMHTGSSLTGSVSPRERPHAATINPSGTDVADSETAGREESEPAGYGTADGCTAEYGGVFFPPPPGDTNAWSEILAIEPRIEPAVCRGSDGLANRVDRLRLTGNGVVPLVAAYAFVSLAAVITR